MAELQVQTDEEIDQLLKAATAPSLSPNLHRKISGTLADSLQTVKPLPSAGVQAGQFAAIFFVFAAALIAMMGITGFRTLNALQVLGILTILAVGVSLFSLV